MSDDVSDPARSESSYREISAARKRFVLPVTVFVLAFYFLLPILGNFTAVLDPIAFSGLSLAYLFAFAQFVMVLIITTVYRRKMDALETRLASGAGPTGAAA